MGVFDAGGKLAGLDNFSQFPKLNVMTKKNGKMTLEKLARMVERRFSEEQLRPLFRFVASLKI